MIYSFLTETIRKIHSLTLILLFLSVVLFLAACQETEDTYTYPLHKLHATAKLTNFPAYLSKVTRAPENTLFIIGDFVNLFLFDYSTNLLQTIEVLYNGTFEPTDTHFDPSSKRLYIAKLPWKQQYW